MAYPAAARPYRDAALAVYRYMTSLPAMTALVDSGRPNQKYQHNAYVSKTHAAHIRAMIRWAKAEPAQRERAMRFAKASAEYVLKELEPKDAPLAWWPPTYGRKPLEYDPKTDGPYRKVAMVGNEPEGAVKYRGEVMLLYPADVGIAFLDYWRETKDERFLAAARGIAETYLKTRRADGSWPLKMKLATGETVGENTLVPNYPMALFNALHTATGESKWNAASDACFAWLDEHPLRDWNWDGQFEDVRPCKPYANPTKHNAVDTVFEILRRYPGDVTRIAQCRKIMEFCEKRFVVWEAPENHPKWPAPSVLEQYSCFTPIDASAAKMIRGYLAMYRAEGRAEDLAKARALADAVTRVQKPSGRIPTFWEGVNTGDSGLTNERYDWLNCMAASADALLEMDALGEGIVERETLLASVQWTAKWIGAPEGVTDQAFERQFEVSRPVKSAVLHITGLGFYEAYLNGAKIGNKVLDPSPTDYARRVFYSTYAIDGLRKGTNTLRILLGHGWYDMRTHTAWGFDAAPWRARPKALAQLEIEFEDGMRQVVATDADWDVVESPIVYDCLREGEVQDGHKVFGRQLGVKAVKVDAPKGALESGDRYPAARKVSVVRPERVIELGNGCWLLSFPVTTSGWLRLVLRGQRSGDVVSIRYDENLGREGSPAIPTEGNWNEANHKVGTRLIDCFFLKSGDETTPKRQANMQVDRYISSGAAEEVFEPHFVYHGFRYVLIEGLRGRLSADDARAVTVQTDFAQTGSFACSDTVLTELVRMAMNSYRANFSDGIPTDCPHREKLGWTGDAWIASETGLTYFDAAVSYRKWYQDVLDTQRPDGSICAIAPTSGWGYDHYAGPVFDGVIGMLPWNLWRFRGDRAIVDTAYPALVKYLSREKSLEKSPGLVDNGLGDWNALFMSHVPEKEYVVSCLYLRLKEIAAEFAELKGLADDGRKFRDSADETRRALREKYGKGAGVYANGGQTAQALAIEMGLCTEDERAAAARRLVASVERAGCHVDFGLVGSKFVYRALSDVGRSDLAYRMIVNPTEPSMTKWIGKNGTLWEDWGEGFSKCHVMLSDFAAWAQQYVAGIRRPLEPGYRRVLIEPVPVAELSWARGRVETPRGLIASAWTLAKGRFELKVTVPQGTTATVRLPDGSAKEVGPGAHVLACDFERM